MKGGKYVDGGGRLKEVEYRDEEYGKEMEKIGEGLMGLVKMCKENERGMGMGVKEGWVWEGMMWG